METITTRKVSTTTRRHLFLTSISTTPDALLRLIRQRGSIENEWHWARDAQLGEEAHRYTNRTGVLVSEDGGDEPTAAWRLPLDPSGLRELAYVIKRMLAPGGVSSLQDKA